MVIVRRMLANFHTVNAVNVFRRTIIVNGTTKTRMKSKKLKTAACSYGRRNDEVLLRSGGIGRDTQNILIIDSLLHFHT